jgi:hypothetical protein
MVGMGVLRHGKLLGWMGHDVAPLLRQLTAEFRGFSAGIPHSGVSVALKIALVLAARATGQRTLDRGTGRCCDESVAPAGTRQKEHVRYEQTEVAQ